MRERTELASSDQFTLHAMFEIIAACAVVFAVLPYRDLVLCTTAFAVLTVWSVRVTNWSIRLPLMACLGGCCVLCLGLACVEQAFRAVASDPRPVRLEQAVFFGTMAATLGAVSGVSGLTLLLVVIGVARAGGRGH